MKEKFEIFEFILMIATLLPPIIFSIFFNFVFLDPVIEWIILVVSFIPFVITSFVIVRIEKMINKK